MAVELTGDVFEQITGYRASPMSPVPQEKRDTPRLPLSRRALATRWHGNRACTPTAVMIREISVAGISLLTSERFEPDEVFTVAVPRREGDPVTVQCVVIRCEPGGTGRQQFVIGAAFVAVEPERAPTGGAARTAPSPPPRAGSEAEIRRIQQVMFGV